MKNGLSKTRFSSWLDTAMPVPSTQPSETPSRQQTHPSKPSSSALPAGEHQIRPFPGNSAAKEEETKTDTSTSPGPRTRLNLRAKGPGLPWRLRRARVRPGRKRHDNNSPLPTTETPPNSSPLTWEGRRTRPQHIPGGGTGRGSAGHGHRRHFLNRGTAQ